MKDFKFFKPEGPVEIKMLDPIPWPGTLPHFAEQAQLEVLCPVRDCPLCVLSMEMRLRRLELMQWEEDGGRINEPG